ncbi:MAG: hypothetical protein WBG71_08065 [Leeuwenhoekiella sp.]
MDLKEFTKDLYSNSDQFKILPESKWWKISLLHDDSLSINPRRCAKRCYHFLETILKENSSFTTVQDYTNPGYSNCQNIQLIKDDFCNCKSPSICINISNAIPLYTIHVLEVLRNENDFSQWKNSPERKKKLEKKDYANLIGSIRNYLNSFLREFPEELIDKKLSVDEYPNLEGLGLTYYNAYLSDIYYTR